MTASLSETWGWPASPTFPFEWTTARCADCDPDLMLLGRLFRGDAIRHAPLRHWPGARLVQLGRRSDGGALQPIASVVHLPALDADTGDSVHPAVQGDFTLLDGSSHAIHRLNHRVGVQFASAAIALEYVAFYSAFIRAEQGSFELLTPESALIRGWPEAARRLVESPIHLGSMRGVGHLFDVRMLYARRIYRATLLLEDDGNVRMLSDTRLTDLDDDRESEDPETASPRRVGHRQGPLH